MKKALFLSMLITIGFLICSCGQKKESTPSNTEESTVSDNTGSGSATGEFNASGTITFKADGEDYTCAISKVLLASTSITIQTATEKVKTDGSLVVTCYTAESAVKTGTYTASSPKEISTVTFINRSVMPYSAMAGSSGSSCIVNITTLNSTTVKGTFTATVLKAGSSSTSMNITDGVIDCTIASE